MDTSIGEFKRHHAFMTVMCIVFGSMFLALAILSTVCGDEFFDALFSFFGS
ncbi:hypothetical protein [Paraburkholderia caribensis]|uniref:hypothetical protein n=1 Tax=Paraburkholderia caribensis TaxID=75105 RepID=UPI0028613863|nr:hypothetical protein [Paraburkholderia caribensis]MDR6381792.1 hypothetical protein [Paraburkholderia caribensis]